MKRVLCLLMGWLLAAGWAWSQDFVTRFMQDCKKDTALHCVTVSPRMIAKMQTEKEANKNLFSKIKSMRTVETNHRVEAYSDKAEELLRKNAHRFSSFMEDSTNGQMKLYVRRKDGIILEMVLITCSSDKFRIVNLTGDMDNEFIRQLAHGTFKNN